MTTLTNALRLGSRRFLANNQLQVSSNSSRYFHPSLPVQTVAKNQDGLFKVTLVPGDGVGPELMRSVEATLTHLGAPIIFETLHLSEVSTYSSATLDKVVKSINNNSVAMKGVIGIPDSTNTGELQNLNQMFRNSLDIYANVIRAKSLEGVKSKYNDLDIVIVREQTEGEYRALEHQSYRGVVESLKITTSWKSRRIAKFAFDYAKKHGRSKVTAVHKANIMKQGDGLFLRSCEEISELYPDIEFESLIVDNAAMQMVSRPQQFDVVVTTNLYGNILSNISAGLVGGAGLVAGASYSSNVAIFEPGARHTYDEATGKEIIFTLNAKHQSFKLPVFFRF